MPSPTDDEDLLDLLNMVAEPAPQQPAPTSADSEADDSEVSVTSQANVAVARSATPARPAPPVDDDGDDPAAFMAGVQQEKTVCYKKRPWMDEHKFRLVRTVEELRQIVDEAIAAGECSLDLETQGLDNRIYWRSKEDFTDRDRNRALRRAEDLSEIWEGFFERGPGKAPETVHKIVGYCLCYDGMTGIYVPIRHTAEKPGNISPADAAREIRRLCLASQPTLTEEGLRDDPLSSRSILTPGKVKIDFWHAKFDQEFLFPITGIEFWHPDSFEDGNLFYFCKYTGDKHLSLKDKAPEELKTPKGHPYEMIEIKELFVSSSGKKREIDFASLHPEEAYEYGCSDGICTLLLCKKPENLAILRDAKTEKNLRIAQMYRLEKQVAQVLRGMERPRIQLDIEYVKNLFTEATQEAAKYEEEVRAIAVAHGWHDLDLKSSKQLSEFCFTDRGLNIEPKPPMNEASGQYKTDADTLEGLVENHPNVNPVLKTIVKFRQVDKVIGTYLTNMVNNCDANSEIRYQFKQTGAATARFSAPAGQPEHGYSGVPIHGIPATYDDKKPKCATALRKAFRARPGYTMVKVDFAGEELRIATNLSGEPVWIDEFTNGTGDLHTITARAFFNKQDVSKQERQMGKMANFSLLYGGGAAAIVRATGCSQVEAQRRKQNFDKALPTFARWTRNQKALCHKDKGVWTAFRRWVAVPEIESPEKPIVAGAERASINYPVQGTGADIMKIAMILLHKEFYKRGWLPTQNDYVRMLLTVHDEIVFEVRHEVLQEAMGVIIRLMEEPGRMAKWTVPLIAEALLDETWDAKYDWDKIIHGKPIDPKKPPKDSDIVFEGKVFAKIPSWLEGYVVPPWKAAGAAAPTVAPEAEAALPSTPEAKPATEAPAAPVEAPKTVPAKSNGNGNGNGAPYKAQPVATPVLPTEVKTFSLNILTKQSVRQVWAAIAFATQESGPVLEVVAKSTGDVLVSSSFGLRVDPEEFQRRLNEYNL